MKTTALFWVSTALVAGLIVGYLVAGSGLTIVKKDFEARLQAGDARIAELETKNADLGSRLVNEQKLAREFQTKAAAVDKFAMAQERIFHQRIEQERTKMRDSMDRMNMNHPFPTTKLAEIANSFHDIQHEVAAGKWSGLALTNGYQRLKEILDNPDMERFLADYDTARGK